MCQPPEITLPSADGASGEFGNDVWALSPEQAAAQWSATQATPTDPSQDFLLNGSELMLKFAHEQQRQRADLSALASMGSAEANQVSSSWPHQDLTEKLQRAAAAAVTAHPAGKPAGTAAALPWLARQQQHYATSPAPAVTPQALWAAAAAAGQPAYMSHLNPGLVAQGIPLGMTQLGHGMMEQSEDDDDPKKHKRMMSNRASAKRSRQRRQERLDELEILSAKLQVENSTVQRRLHDATERIKKFQHENEALQEELRSLKDMVAARGGGGALPHNPLVEHHHHLLATKQDSCSPNGSTTEHPSSDPSETPSPPSLGKRRREEVAESRFQASESGANGYASSGKGEGCSQVTHPSAVKSDSPKQQEKAGGEGEAVMIGLLDDDLFTSIMEECFEAKPIVESAIGRS